MTFVFGFVFGRKRVHWFRSFFRADGCNTHRGVTPKIYWSPPDSTWNSLPPASEVSLNDMRYISPHFTYLLT